MFLFNLTEMRVRLIVVSLETKESYSESFCLYIITMLINETSSIQYLLSNSSYSSILCREHEANLYIVQSNYRLKRSKQY